jgi:hypothetical protein
MREKRNKEYGLFILAAPFLQEIYMIFQLAENDRVLL